MHQTQLKDIKIDLNRKTTGEYLPFGYGEKKDGYWNTTIKMLGIYKLLNEYHDDLLLQLINLDKKS